MKKVKYNGDFKVILPSLNIEVNPGDIIDVEDDFINVNFEPVVKPNTTIKKEDNE